MCSLEGRAYRGKYMNSGISVVKVHIMSVALIDCVTSGKSLNLTEPQFPHLYNFSGYAISSSAGAWVPESGCLGLNLNSTTYHL